MTIEFQDPSKASTATLHESFLGSTIGSNAGVGAFAYATKLGIDLLLKDEQFASFLSNDGFTLLVGFESVTNESALEELKSLSDAYGSKLNILGYYSSRPGCIFHPKMAWLHKAGGGATLIVGSGNLTYGGLRGNLEAFMVQGITEEEFCSLESMWAEWLQRNKDYIYGLDSDVIRQAAKSNSAQKYGHRKLDQTSRATQDPDVESWRFEYDCEMLVAEIPRASSRWSQANFDKGSFTNYFGFTVETSSQRALLRCIRTEETSSGAGYETVLGDVEVRPNVAVASHNWRIELSAAKGIPYPDTGRPTAVFARVGTRAFLYELLMPSNLEYDAVQSALALRKPFGPSMRRELFQAEELFDLAPGLSIWEQYNARQ